MSKLMISLLAASGIAFAGWREPPHDGGAPPDLGTAHARTWLLRVGWRRHGTLAFDEPTGPPRRATIANRRSSSRTSADHRRSSGLSLSEAGDGDVDDAGGVD